MKRRNEADAIEAREIEALALTEELEVQTMNPRNLKVAQLKVLVGWKKGGKDVPVKKDELIVEWNKYKNSEAPRKSSFWTEADEAELQRLQESEISLAETEVGRQAERLVQDFTAAIPNLSGDDKEKVKQLLGASETDTDAYVSI